MLAKGEGLEHVQSEIEGAIHQKALGLEGLTVRGDEITSKNNESVRTPTASMPQTYPLPSKRLKSGGHYASSNERLQAIEDRCAKMESKLDNLSSTMKTGFAEIQASLLSLSSIINAVNLTKGEKVIDQKEAEQPEIKMKSQGEADKQGEQRSKGEQKETAIASGTGEFFAEIDGETMLVSEEVLQQIQRNQASSIKISEPVPEKKESTLQRLWREKEESNKMGKGKDKLPEYVNPTEIVSWTDGSTYSPEEADSIMVSHMESTLNNKDAELFNALVNRANHRIWRKTC